MLQLHNISAKRILPDSIFNNKFRAQDSFECHAFYFLDSRSSMPSRCAAMSRSDRWDEVELDVPEDTMAPVEADD